MSNIHYQVFGQGQPLVMIHGWAMHSGIWQSFAEQLAEHCQVICVDLPGHGLSESIEPFSLQNISDSLIQGLPVQRFSVLGWSLGATVAIDMAGRYPERVQSLQLLAGNPLFVQNSDWPGVKTEILDAFAEQLASNVQQTLVRFLGLQVKGLPDAKTLLQHIKAAVQAYPAPSLQALQAGLQILKNSDERLALQQLQCPVSVLIGDRDTLIPLALAESLKKLQPAIQVHLLENAGHVPFLSHSQQLLERVIADL
ncbi:MAG: pimeloyl-ACP methyl ester esterase BioH [Methylomonas sp.]